METTIVDKGCIASSASRGLGALKIEKDPDDMQRLQMDYWEVPIKEAAGVAPSKCPLFLEGFGSRGSGGV